MNLALVLHSIDPFPTRRQNLIRMDDTLGGVKSYPLFLSSRPFSMYICILSIAYLQS